MLFKENRGLKIEKEFVKNIIDFLTDKGWIKENVRIKYEDDIGYNFATGWGKLDGLYVLGNEEAVETSAKENSIINRKSRLVKLIGDMTEDEIF